MKFINKDFFKKYSLFKRIFIQMCMLIIVIIVAIIGIGVYYDVLGEIDQNSQNLFDQQVFNRSHDLQTMMVTKWSNLEIDMNRINAITEKLVNEKKISLNNLSYDSDDSTVLLDNVSNELISMLRNHGTTGAYILLSDGQFENHKGENFYPGLYVIDNDPEGDFSGTSDLLLARSPMKLVNKLNIPTDSCWQPSFEFKENDHAFYQKAFDNFQLVLKDSDFSLKDVGCWIQPYQLYGSNTYRISYMLPLICNQKIYGAIGIDIAFPYLQKILNYNELTSNEHGGYMLALQQDDHTYQSLFLNGPYYSRSFKQFSTIETKDNNGEYINNEIYCSSSPIKLYNTNTPYEEEQWVLLGLVDKGDLFSLTNQMIDMLMFMFTIIVIIGFIISFIMTRYISKPIIDLATRIAQTTNATTRLNLKRTNILEIDQLIVAIEKMSDDVLESASRFTNIIRLANTKLAGFEIDYQTHQFFITEGFFDIFMLFDIDTQGMTFEEFTKIFKAFDSSCTPTQNRNEYMYHIESEGEQIYLRLRYMETEEKCVGLIEEVSDIIKERQAIEHERDHDVLTDLINRRAFQRQMKRLFSIYPHLLKTAALVMMDLDNLKAINDKYGHDCGDAYIKASAETFRDYSPEKTIVSRTSGDEFYLFYYGYETKEQINLELQKLKHAIDHATVQLPNEEVVRIRVSGGIAWYPDDSMDFDELQRFSDYAMYSVKHTVKGEIGMFNISDYENNSYITKKRIDFHQLIDDRNMIYYVYQPIVNAHTGEIFGYEALMRSHHPTLRNPKEIISLAKLEAQLNKIEFITWFRALETYSEYSQKELVTKEQKLCINSISNQILDEKYLFDLERQYGYLLERVVLEVTEDEQEARSCFEKKKTVLTRWKSQIALDDYGSGYNSERNLLSVNPDYVKIDMDIIRDIDKDADKQKIVENIISYCHERHKKVIAEGVETMQELRVVLYLEVDYIQGYLFAKPQSIPSKINQEAVKELLDIYKKSKKRKK
ncbi:MAG: EAL domain-containing protein [Longibaculum sp.]